MSNSKLPERPSLEYLKRLAKEQLAELRQTEPRAKLAAAQFAVAQRHGFSSWRSLKAEVDARRAPELAEFFSACETGTVETLRPMLEAQPNLVRERNGAGQTGLHLAARHESVVRLLLDHGADPNERDSGDNASPLHFAASKGALGSVRALLDAGADVHGEGDLHGSGVIGWATLYDRVIHREVLELLISRGARHHIFSAIATLDLELIQELCEDNPEALARRLSRFEQKQTPLHYVVAPPDGLIGGGFRTGAHYAALELLIELGVELEAEDDKGRTALGLAMSRGDEKAMRRLHAAGAKTPAAFSDADFDAKLAALAGSIKKVDAMLRVPDMAATVEWYRSIGFKLDGQHEHDGKLDWAGLSFGASYLMLVPDGSTQGRDDVSFWFRTDRVDDLYHVLKRRQLDRARRTLSGETPSAPEVRFTEELHDTHYGSREFTVADLNGYKLVFIGA